ncbi:ABC transporter ATP-binding protein [Telmatospirillum sp.]|uniref:ABC transporter ATP-binding protein n=1 Tax=Telmatospirillum sp. TaxID=2079197 RepID=UPI0028499E59|nr:ABC transporter ATP-binding protein [Telmatospirillum sp.]MDR3437403.1 ABC transporter ATP-binding protein [Telmatospirillum sp.]
MTVPPLLDIDNLVISYDDHGRRRAVVHGVTFAIKAGEVVAVVGESGSGKTTTAQSIIGLLPENGRIDGGAIRLNGTDISGWPQRRFDGLRGVGISLVPQDPGVSLNPVRTIGSQVGEILKIHAARGTPRRAIHSRVIELLDRVGLNHPEMRAGQYPHELSGGMKQRVLIAIAIALRPQLIIADEPTSALDVTVQKRILDLIDDLRAEYGTAVLLVTHDLGIAAERADRVVIVKDGRIEEQGPAAELLAHPRSDYAIQLLSNVPSLARSTPRQTITPIDGTVGGQDAVVVEGLTHVFAGRHLAGPRSPVIDSLSFRIPTGTTHALVGESGSGKTTTIRAIVGLLKPTGGRVLVDGHDVATLRGEALRRFRRTIQLVYQNPFSSLDPRQSIGRMIEEPLLNFEPVAREERARRAETILERVHLPRTILDRRPRALSGGQRQRVAIARALILDPRILILDEAVSALDVTAQAQILALLDELQRDLDLTYLFVSHDLAVVRQISDTVSVLRHGVLMESGPTETIFTHPTSDYTRDLIDAIPGRRPASPISSNRYPTPQILQEASFS